jgi:hypothetical protein
MPARRRGETRYRSVLYLADGEAFGKEHRICLKHVLRRTAWEPSDFLEAPTWRGSIYSPLTTWTFVGVLSAARVLEVLGSHGFTTILSTSTCPTA